ncbi:MAG: tRNA uridine(34) 5-carboxymethylaminomethyl modification radical SAM/GNAT enzyme Elp3 [Candidatus Hadarchaeales archaeon]
MMSADLCRRILEEIPKLGGISRKDVAKLKLKICGELGVSRIPKNSEILAVATPEERERLVRLLKLKPVRSASGVTVITVMPKPLPCPKPEPCIYCPGGPEAGVNQSYTGREPASMRAVQHDFDPYSQVKNRIEQLRAIGHEVDKVELIVFGGTLTAYPRDYLEWFVKECLRAITGENCETLEKAKLSAEISKIRISDIAFETRPDWCKEPHVDLMLDLGATRVELGVQTIYEDVYEIINRGHAVEDVIEATRIAKDAGMAVVYHMMPGLPGSNPDRDLEMFREIFRNPDFRPDALKIYPCLVLRGTKLYELWKRGEFKPMTTEEAVELLTKIKQEIPAWVRIQRIQRDIPADLIEAGVRAGNLRQIVKRRLEVEGKKCKCIRCREVGHAGVEPENLELFIERYEASGGEEVFLSIEDREKDVLLAILRLRVPSEHAHRPELKNATIVRELHVYGELVPVGLSAEEGEWQHRGLGKTLLKEAERISEEEYGARKIAVLAGIGTREYYRKLGFRKDNVYMSKEL